MRYKNHWGHADFYAHDLQTQKALKRAIDLAVLKEVPPPIWKGAATDEDAWKLFINTARLMASLVGYEPHEGSWPT